jgi:NAD dependent epimerase/dehydratase family enzyme
MSTEPTDTSLTSTQSPIAVVAGASGFIGGELLDALNSWGYATRTIGRSPASADAIWDRPDRIAELIDGADLLINLAGRSVGCRYTDAEPAGHLGLPSPHDPHTQ